MNEDLIIKARIQLLTDQAKLKTQVKKYTSGVSVQIARAQQNVERSTERLNKALGRVPFAGYAMSIMFFGMAMQRTFSQIARFGTKTFQDVMHSVEGTVTNTDLLESSMKYLGFSIGQALEPVIAFLIPIVEAVASWAAENPKLTATIVALGLALGTLFMVGGAGKLALDGFTALKSIIGSLGVGGFAAGPLAIAAAAAALLVKAFLETPEAWGAVKKAFKEIKEALDPVIESVNNLLASFGIQWEDIAWTAAWAFAIVVDALKIVGNAVALVVNVVSGLVSLFKLAGDSAKLMWDAIRGKDVTTGLATVVSDLQNIKNSIESAKNNLANIGGVTIGMGGLLAGGPSGYKESVTNNVTINIGALTTGNPGYDPGDILGNVLGTFMKTS